MKNRTLIVGAGLAGCVSARVLAENGCLVTIIDRKEHIAGCAYDYVNDAGITIHKYGPHIFHTNDKIVWDFLSRFTGWLRYQHTVLGWIQGRHVPLPVNIDTLNRLYGLNLDAAGAEKFLKSKSIAVAEPQNMREAVISQIGEELYGLVFENYTKKQWGMDPSELPAAIAARVPARLNRDPRYFTDRYQGIPAKGYTSMFANMLDHPNISVKLSVDATELGISAGADGGKEWNRVIYSGGMDEYFANRFGPLPYRSLDFILETLDVEFHQPAAVVNFPNDYDFTRITEFKHFTGEKSHKTTVMLEYPSAEGEPYYPIPVTFAKVLYKKYVDAVADTADRTVFLGRMAEYRYMNMDQVVASVLGRLGALSQ